MYKTASFLSFLGHHTNISLVIPVLPWCRTRENLRNLYLYFSCPYHIPCDGQDKEDRRFSDLLVLQHLRAGWVDDW